MKPGAAGEAQKQTAGQERQYGEPKERNAARQKAEYEQQHGIDQKRTENIGVLERPADAIVEKKHIVMRYQVKKSDIAGQRRIERGQNISAAQQFEPDHVAVAEQ